MTSVSSSPAVLPDLLDVVETALASVARRLPAHVGRDDLASAGKVALVSAFAQVAGPADEVRAYCFVRVRGAMLDELRRLDRLSRRARAQATAVAAAQAALGQALGREPTTDELAATTRLTPAEVDAARAARAEPTVPEVAWDALPDETSPSPAENAERTDLQSALRDALARLPANQSLALRLYYLEDGSLDDIAGRLGVSRERARQVREAGEKRLRADFVVLSLWQTVLRRA